MAIGAVITADIVNSTRHSSDVVIKLRDTIGQVLSSYKYEFYRGDSFQVLVKDPKEALTAIVRIRAEARKLSMLLDVRAAIGIGEVSKGVKKLSVAVDEAFVLSGRTFDLLGKESDRNLAIVSPAPVVNHGLNVIAQFTDYLYRALTEKQAEVLIEMLKGQSQQEVARQLEKSQSTINQHVQSAGWYEITALQEEYKNLVSSIII